MLLKRRAIYQSDQPLTQASLRRQLPIVRRGQIVRAVLIGLVFALIFLWAVPQHRLLYAETQPFAPRANAAAAI